MNAPRMEFVGNGYDWELALEDLFGGRLKHVDPRLVRLARVVGPRPWLKHIRRVHDLPRHATRGFYATDVSRRIIFARRPGWAPDAELFDEDYHRIAWTVQYLRGRWLWMDAYLWLEDENDFHAYRHRFHGV